MIAELEIKSVCI